MRVAPLVFALVGLVAALATGGGCTTTPSDGCIVSLEGEMAEEERTFQKNLNVLLRPEGTAARVKVTHGNKQECILNFSDLVENTWVRATIHLADTIRAEVDVEGQDRRNISISGDCNVAASSSFKKVKIVKGHGLFNCHNGPVVFQVDGDMTNDCGDIYWYEGAVNVTLTPLVDARIRLKIGDNNEVWIEEANIDPVTKEAFVEVSVTPDGYSYKIGDGNIEDVKKSVKKVEVCRDRLDGPVIVEQRLGTHGDISTTTFTTSTTSSSPASTSTNTPIVASTDGSTTQGASAVTDQQGLAPPDSPWVYAGLPLAVILGVAVGVVLTKAWQGWRRSGSRKTTADPRPAHQGPEIVEVTNDMYEPLEGYRNMPQANNTHVGSSPVVTEEVVNDMYEPFDDVWARSRQQQ